MHEKIKSNLHSENLHSENDLPLVTALEREPIKKVEDENDFVKAVAPLETFWQDKKNRDSVIISTILGQKNERAKEFENIFKSIGGDLDTKAKVKEDFKARMAEEFEKNRDYYTEESIALAKNIEGLFYIFDQFKKNEEGNVVIGGVEKEELKRNITLASKEIDRQISQGELVNPDLEQITFSLSLFALPNKYKITDQLAKIIKKNLASETKKEATPTPILEENKPKILDRLKGFFRRRW
ncbi:MAG TPA: hypothetical protein P5274_00160 [Candidatus Paceibacterota bacterium]|nr:hypothetical protein [Candidatus Paceibacterota bacterium]